MIAKSFYPHSVSLRKVRVHLDRAYCEAAICMGTRTITEPEIQQPQMDLHLLFYVQYRPDNTAVRPDLNVYAEWKDTDSSVTNTPQG